MMSDNGVCVYQEGKWAEIIPDKKKLPKTREEFLKFLSEFSLSSGIVPMFLKEYED